MHISEKSNSPLEILIATMNRTSLDFLDAIFRNVDSTEYHILIINQTTPERLLESNNSRFRVINSFEKGLSKSRNLALQNAKGNIVLIADDDVVFKSDFFNTILTAFHKKPDTSLITFIAKDFESNFYRKYPSDSQLHNLNSIKNVISWEIAFRLENIQKLHVRFDEYFGLGSQFATGEEYLFVKDVINCGETCYFENVAIVSHPEFSSGKEEGSDRLVYARAALNYKVNRELAYFWVPKYVFFLLRHHYIKFNDLKGKIAMGLKGIRDYKILEH